MADIFLSYNREDQAIARRYAEAFEQAGLSVWWDVTLRSGESYDIVTENALRGARAVVVLWSKRSVVSRWVRAEATIADRCKTLVPVMIEDCERPIMFELVQTADLTHWEGDPHDRAWLAYLDDVRRFVASHGGATDSAADVASTGDALRAMAETAPRTPSKPSVGQRSTLAVLPFATRSKDPEDEDFADIVGEDLTAALSQTWGLHTLSYATMAKYRDEAIDVKKLGSEHGVDYFLEGNIRRLGSKVRIAAQLVDAHTGGILYTQKFDRPSDEILDLVDEVVDDVNTQLGVQLQRIELERASKKEKSETAWDAMMRCWALIPRMSIQSLEQAVRHARRAVELAPDYSLAHSTLGLILGLLYQRDGSRKPELLTEALEHVDIAIHSDARHHVVLFNASLVKYYAQQWEESLRLAESAVEVNPSSADAMQHLAGALTRYERYDEAIEWLDKADHLAPRGYTITISLINRCWTYYGMDRFEDGVKTATEILKIMPSDHTGLMLRPIFYAELGEWDLAKKDMAELRRCYPDEPLELFIGTIKTSRQTDAKRDRNAELFEKIWKLVDETQDDSAMTEAES